MSDLTVARTILEQLGGQRRLALMTGAKQFAGDETSVKFRFGPGVHDGQRVNCCKITLDPSDTYTFELYHVSLKDIQGSLEPKFQMSDVYDDVLMDVFEQKTGLYLTLGRRQ